jgi:hypothetical protein
MFAFSFPLPTPPRPYHLLYFVKCVLHQYAQSSASPAVKRWRGPGRQTFKFLLSGFKGAKFSKKKFLTKII